MHNNLINSFPEKNSQEILKIEKGFYSFFCDYIVETIKMNSISKKSMMKHMTFDGLDAIRNDMDNHDLCFVYLGHYCNWEWVASLPLWTGEKLHCAQIYHPLENKVFNDLFLRQRARFGAENIAMNDTLRRIVTLRNEGKKTVIGFISDQTPHWNSIHLWMDFLHQETPVFTGTERIAEKVNSCMYYLDVRCLRRGYYHATFRLMTAERNAVSKFKMTEAYMHLLEDTIKDSPAFWLWSHNRWKRKRNMKRK